MEHERENKHKEEKVSKESGEVGSKMDKKEG